MRMQARRTSWVYTVTGLPGHDDKPRYKYWTSDTAWQIIDYFENLGTKNISDNETFQKTVKSLLCNKCRAPEYMTIVKGNGIISGGGKIADAFLC